MIAAVAVGDAGGWVSLVGPVGSVVEGSGVADGEAAEPVASVGVDGFVSPTATVVGDGETGTEDGVGVGLASGAEPVMPSVTW
jgi:hypothetical protein